jgi:hypothetical protein
VRLHARCVWFLSVCFSLFDLFPTAIEQDASLTSSNRAITKAGKTLQQQLLRHRWNAHSPAYG